MCGIKKKNCGWASLGSVRMAAVENPRKRLSLPSQHTSDICSHVCLVTARAAYGAEVIRGQG